jgi:hypothetical protein
LVENCKKLNAVPITPESDWDLALVQQIRKKLSLPKIHINIAVSRGSMFSAVDSDPIGDGVITDSSTFKLLQNFYPVLTDGGVASDNENTSVTAFCQKPNNPWDKPGPTKNRWKEIFNSDDQSFWGSGLLHNKEVQGVSVDGTNEWQVLHLELPPLAAIVLV